MPPNEQRQDDTYDDIQDVVERGDDALPKKREQADLHEVSAHRHKAGGDDSPPAHNSHIRHVHRSILPETAMLRQRQMRGRTAHWLTYRCNRRTCSLAARIFRSADGPRPQRPRGPGGFEMSERASASSLLRTGTVRAPALRLRRAALFVECARPRAPHRRNLGRLAINATHSEFRESLRPRTGALRPGFRPFRRSTSALRSNVINSLPPRFGSCGSRGQKRL